MSDAAALEAALRAHPAVLDVVVGDDGVVWVIPDVPRAGAATQWAERRVAGWQLIWERAYADLAASPDPTFNTSSWTSAVTGAPFADEVMRDWVEQTVRRLAPLPARRVLELGCGSGLLLHRLAPSAEEYVGCDFSAAAVAYLGQQLAGTALAARVRLLERAADQLDDLPAGHFDLVILNSVAQYFPSLDYLTAVLAGAARVLRPGGAIFAGDLRSLPSLRAFWTAVKEHHGATSAREIDEAVRREAELVVDPDYFRALPGFGDVAVLLKRGHAPSEMNRFRYDVILRMAATEAGAPASEWQVASPDALAGRLRAEAPAAVRVADLPDARLVADPTWDPEAVWALAEAAGYQAELTPAGVGRFDAILWRSGAPRPPRPAVALDPSRRLATEPLLARLARALVPELKALCASQLGVTPDIQLCAARPVVASTG